MKTINRQLILFLALFAVLFGTFYYYYTEKQAKLLTQKFAEQEHQKIVKTLHRLIQTKEKSNMAIALTLQLDDSIAKFVNQGKIEDDYFQNYINKIRKNTLYKNLWIQLIDTQGRSLYRSWTAQKGDDLASVRNDVARILEHRKPQNSVNAGKFDLSFNSMVPVYDESG